MSKKKTIEEVSDSVVKKVRFEILRQWPEPDCFKEKEKWLSEVKEIKKQVAGKLSPQGLSIKIEI